MFHFEIYYEIKRKKKKWEGCTFVNMYWSSYNHWFYGVKGLKVNYLNWKILIHAYLFWEIFKYKNLNNNIQTL
jgi:hypothetical protein